MRDTEHFKNHMAVVTDIHAVSTGHTDHYRQEIEDPFIHNKTIIRWTLLEWLAMLFRWPREVEVRVSVQADGCAMGRWFQGADICERCCHRRIDLPGQHPTKPGYESCGQRICEACYYDYSPEESVAAGVDAIADDRTTGEET